LRVYVKFTCEFS